MAPSSSSPRSPTANGVTKKNKKNTHIGSGFGATIIIVALSLLSLITLLFTFNKKDYYYGMEDNEILEILSSIDAKSSIQDANGNDDDDDHKVAGLSCELLGGPTSSDAVNEMIYWQDIPNDANFTSIFHSTEEEQYLTMEPDEGGWNNIRMGMETAVGIAIMTGRTLVLPPDMSFYLLWFGKSSQQNQLSFEDFFHFTSVQKEHATLKVITFQEFLQKVALTGQLIDTETGEVSFPPENNRTDWTDIINYQSAHSGVGKVLWPWVRKVTKPLTWNSDKCVAAFASEPGQAAADRLTTDYLDKVINIEGGRKGWKRIKSYDNNPTPVDGNVTSRLDEILALRSKLCVYDESFQNAKVIHAMGEGQTHYRLLIHFYAFLFFENYQYDLWYKRFVRDHLRYVDEVQCCAARIIAKLRSLARKQNASNIDGTYDAFHIRRGDFQYNEMRHMTAEEIYQNAEGVIPEKRIVFIATDEKNQSFFEPFAQHYNIYFLNNFATELSDVNKNYYGMIDQLVASRSEVFFGAFFSTFTGYINRLRGYHSQKNKSPGYELGIINSYYYVPDNLKEYYDAMRKYRSVQPAFWQQEYAVCWRDIDHDITEQLEGN